jgi:hypothetical protein
VAQPQIAPRFSRTPGSAKVPCHPGEHDAGEIVAEWKSGA